jgi:hypothetical protein
MKELENVILVTVQNLDGIQKASVAIGVITHAGSG